MNTILVIAIILGCYIIYLLARIAGYETTKRRLNEEEWEELIEYADSVRSVSPNKSLTVIIKEYEESLHRGKTK